MSDAPLQGKRGVLAAIEGRANQRIATGPLATHYCARLAGRSIAEYTMDPAALADSVARYYERFHPDAVWLSADTWVTAEAMGAAVRFPGEDQPKCGTGRPLVQSAGDLERIPRPDPGSQGRWPLMLEALAQLRRRLGNDVFLVACLDQYPFSLACELLGVEGAMLQANDDRSLLNAVMDRAVEYGLAYGLALARAGADMLSGGDSPAGLLGPRLYGEVALPWERRLIAALRASCQVPVSLHICGDARPILTAMASSGADVLELDHRVDIAAAARQIGPLVALWGNLDPVAVLSRGSVAEVRKATHDLIQAVEQAGHRRFVLSSGCTLAPETPAVNLDAMFEVARQGELQWRS